MKQETIDLIKSMTEQGFLVIVDPEKLNDQDRIVVNVMDWKDPETLDTAHHTGDAVGYFVHGNEKINAEIAELAGFKKEEPNPEIDLLKCDGRRFRAKIEGVECKGVVSVDALGNVYLCQSKKDGVTAADKKGYEFSWIVKQQYSFAKSFDLDFYKVTDFELLPEPRVIFTNCVGEVFTEEDIERNSKVYRWSLPYEKIYHIEFNKIHSDYYGSDDQCGDIFRSKKSLLKYLYEACE